MEDIFIGLGANKEPQVLKLSRANRHGLIAGATGTGKTVTLQTIAEQFSAQGVPVFLADVKGDLSGICMPGSSDFKHAKVLEGRAREIGIENYTYSDNPAVFWDLYGEKGHPIRTTISEMGPLLLSRLLGLNDTQEGVLSIAFKWADDNGLLLLDLEDLQQVLITCAEQAGELATTYGNISKASVGTIQRQLLAFESQGADKFFGEPAFEINDFIRCDDTGPDGVKRGIINVLSADKLMQSPKLYATFLLWLLSELFEALPEVGDPEKPRLVFFFDEAHLLFDDAPAALFDKVEQVVRLIRSKGVGVYFISQNPIDIPEKIAGQLGNRVQHALRAFTPRDQKAIKAAAETFRINPDLDVETAITELRVGEALVSTLDEEGAPTIVQRTLVAPPRSRLGPVTDKERAIIQSISPFDGKYEAAVDRESAAEVLAQKASDAAQAAQVVEEQGEEAQRAQPRQTPSMWEKAGKAAFGAAAASAGGMIARSVTGRKSGGSPLASAASAVAGSLGTALRRRGIWPLRARLARRAAALNRLRAALAWAFLALAFAGAAPARCEDTAGVLAPASPPLGKLPAGIAPLAYRLDLTLEPGKPRFPGKVEIDVRIDAETRTVFLHGRDLAVHRATAKAGGKLLTGAWRQVDPTGVAQLTFPEALPAGPATLAFEYDAAFNESPAGLFRVKVGEDWYSWSQFQSIDARSAFPSFDEPGFKTPFSVTLRTRPGQIAVGNAPQVSKALEAGLEVHRFQPTLPLPTYLVAMMAGPFATLEGLVPPTPQRALPLPLRIVSTRQNAAGLAFALEGSKEIVVRLEDYFGQAFPYPKLDQITSPIMPGAMENAGADLYADEILVVDERAPVARKRDFGMVVSHELSHQWFGDLVTPAWWDDIWLNESFANWMGYRIGDEWRPDLRIAAGAIGEGLRGDGYRCAGGGPPDPPADRCQCRNRRRLRFDHLWQGRPCHRDDRRFHGRRKVSPGRAPLHGRPPAWQRHQRRLFRRACRSSRRPADRSRPAQLHRSAGRAVADVRPQGQRLSHRAEPLCTAGCFATRHQLGRTGLPAPGGAATVRTDERQRAGAYPWGQGRLDAKCQRSGLLPFRTSPARLACVDQASRSLARRRGAGARRFAVRQLPRRPGERETVGRDSRASWRAIPIATPARRPRCC